MEVENSVHHKCMKDFLYIDKMGELLGSYKLDPNTIKDIGGYLKSGKCVNHKLLTD
jgi:hypothetical protein